jgi:trimethylamine:corrinoid methyltransferase-like protein
MQIFSSDELNLIHHSSMEILKDAGVRFIAEEALEIFRHHGFKTDGTRVKKHQQGTRNGPIPLHDSSP